MTAVDKDGYGIFMDGDQRKVPAHRFALARKIGAVGPDVLALHRCDTPACVNPDHLFAGTHTDNVRDMLAKGRERPPQRGLTHCRRGHAFDDTNTGVRPGGTRWCKACQRMKRRGH